MALEKIINTDSLNSGKDKINKIIDSLEFANSVINDNFVNKYFERWTGNFTENQPVELYKNRNMAFKELALIGFDQNKKHKLRIIAKNHTSFNDRIIISEMQDTGSWKDIYDTTSTFNVKMVNGIGKIDHEIRGRRVIATIDYNLIPEGISFLDGTLDGTTGAYIFSQEAFGGGNVSAELSTTEVNASQVLLNKLGSKYQFKYMYNDTTSQILEFDKLGINQIIHPKYLRKINENKLSGDFTNVSSSYEFVTDLVSPYSNVIAENGTTSFAGTVGGNHGTTSATGYPTAKNISHDVYVNGKRLEDGVHASDEFVLIVKNAISPSNYIDASTGARKDVIEEIVTYRVTPNNVEVSVAITPSENITISGYAGLQMVANVFNGIVYFTEQNIERAIDGKRYNSPTYPSYDGVASVYTDKVNDVFVTYTNRNVGLGTLSNIGSIPVHYLSTNKKIYSHLLGNPLSINANETVYYSGGYTFMAPIKCVGALSAYFIKENGTKEYIVDFNSSVSTFLEAPELMGREIEVIEKSDTITVDNFATPKGLKIVSTGIGSVRFKVKA